jgi:DNA helicase IV
MSQWMISKELFNDSQLKLLQVPLDGQVLIVVGPPGSGKTLVATHYLKKLLKKDEESAALIVFTHVLLRFIQSGLEELDIPMGKAKLAYSYANNGFEKRDYLIIDEFQDFPLDEKGRQHASLQSGSMETFLAGARKGVLLSGDTKQRVYNGLGWSFSELDKVNGFSKSIRELREHYRLPKAITDAAAALLPDHEAEKIRQWSLNEDVEAQAWKKIISPANGDIEKAKHIYSVVKNRGFRSVGVLVWKNYEGERISKALAQVGAKVHMCLDKNGKQQVDFNDSAIKILTVKSAKGVQFDSVFIPYGENCPSVEQEAYVAVTRPLKMLGILYCNRLAAPLNKIPAELLPEL